jgi:hypothetical protein
MTNKSSFILPDSEHTCIVIGGPLPLCLRYGIILRQGKMNMDDTKS